MHSRRTSSLIIVAFLAATAASAAEPGGTRAQGLAEARQKVARAADRTKGSHRQQLLLEQKRIDRLITDLEQGRTVEPGEIDQAIRRAGGL